MQRDRLHGDVLSGTCSHKVHTGPLRYKQTHNNCHYIQLTSKLDASTSSNSAAAASTPNPSLWSSAGILVRVLFCFCLLGGLRFPLSLWDYLFEVALPAGFCLLPTAAGCFMPGVPLRCCLAGAFGRDSSCGFSRLLVRLVAFLPVAAGATRLVKTYVNCLEFVYKVEYASFRPVAFCV